VRYVQTVCPLALDDGRALEKVAGGFEVCRDRKQMFPGFVIVEVREFTEICHLIVLQTAMTIMSSNADIPLSAFTELRQSRYTCFVYWLQTVKTHCVVLISQNWYQLNEVIHVQDLSLKGKYAKMRWDGCWDCHGTLLPIFMESFA
jgi:hypothetical protein